MKDQLLKLQQEDPACVFICRKIKKLGFESPDSLRAYFGKYGEVRAVLVSHSRGRTAGSVNQKAFKRPAAIGFCLMAEADATAKILASEEHDVNGVTVSVQAFRQLDEEDRKEERQKTEAKSSKRQRKNSGGGGRSRSPARRNGRHDSPTCQVCDSTIAMRLGISMCTICELRRMMPMPTSAPPPSAAPFYPPPPSHYPPPHMGPPPPTHAYPPPGYMR
eukprot:TRINITY_DN42589_c1_g1_i2.p1 TRINITY_DN42589_c1_g1~~TRINITY_DN42589_c1_g1_i2.p1  ORF type:complete len:219 (+),score=44.66 TRINITY_DN42589_c1_g1_i2:561-1217(+)